MRKIRPSLIILLAFFLVMGYVFAEDIPDWSRATKIGGVNDDAGNSINTDSSGNSYIIGDFKLTGYFGSMVLQSSGDYDIFVAKISSTGQWIRATKAGGTLLDGGNSISTDSSGDSYIAGIFRSNSYFGSTVLQSSGDADIFVAKISSTGQRIRATKAGGTTTDVLHSVSIDDEGNSYAIGEFLGTASFGNATFISSGDYDIFVAKISSTGQFLWATKAGGTLFDGGNSISTDSSGNNYIIGIFRGTGYFGNTVLQNSGNNNDIFVAKISSTGQRIRAVKAGGTGADAGRSINIDSSGNSYIIGDFNGTGYFGSTVLQSSGTSDIFVAKISSTGQRIRAVKAGGTAGDQGRSISIDNDENNYIAGLFQGTGYFGSTVLQSSGSSDIFVAKISSTGQFLWATKAGGTALDAGNSISTDSAGNSYIAGYFNGTGYFGSTALQSSGNKDIFIAKLGLSALVSCLGPCDSPIFSRLNVIPNFDYGTARRSGVVVGTDYPILIRFKNTSAAATNKVPLPGGHIFILPATIDSNQTTELNLKIKYFVQ